MKRIYKKTKGVDFELADKNKKYLYLILGALVIAILVISIALIIRNATNPEATDPKITDEVVNVTSKPTQDEESVTKETLEKYAEINIEGYKEDTFGDEVSEAIVVDMKNKSEEEVSLTAEIVVINKNNEIVDSSYISAEEMAPGETQSFPMFTSSSIPMNELKDMEFKVYRVYTYNPTPPEPEVEETNNQ